MKKQIVLLLALVLAAALLSPAAADGIVESGGFSITEIRPSRNGSLEVSWSDPNNHTPYRVAFQPVTQYNADSPTNDQIIWCNSGEVSETKYRELYVVSDRSWWFIVVDSAGNQAVRKYEPENSNRPNYKYAGSFDFDVWPQKNHKVPDGKHTKGFLALNEEDILSAGSNVSCGIQVTYTCLDLPAVRGEMLVMKYVLDDYGKENFPMVICTADNDPGLHYQFSDQYRSFSTYINLAPFVRKMNEMKGSAKGTYTLEVYVNGELAWWQFLAIK